MRDHEEEFSVVSMCRALEIGRSGYYAWRDRGESRRDRANRHLLSEIRMVYDKFRGVYGSPRVTGELHSRGISCGENRVARVMRANGIRAKTVKKYRVTTDSSHRFPVAPNRLDRQFTVAGPNLVWASDITYIGTAEGWLYLAVILDLWSRRVVGWSMGARIDRHLTVAALRQALARRGAGPSLMHHSDQGKQYAADDYQKLLKAHGITCSMSRRGNCWDNAPVESFFATLEKELLIQERFRTRAEARAHLFDYIEIFYNRERRHSSLGNISPVDFENATIPP